MLSEYNSLPTSSKVFIYPSSRKFYNEEMPVVIEKVKIFLEQFKDVDSCFEIKYDRFIVIIVSDQSPLNLDQNNELIDFIQSLENEFKVGLLDKVNVCFKQGKYVQLKEIQEFKKLIKNKGVSKKTIVFDNLLTVKEEYENYWEVAAEHSQIAHFFK